MRRAVLPGIDTAIPFALGPWRGWIERDVEKALAMGLLDDPEAHARAGQSLRENNYRVTSRVVVPGLGAVLVKAHAARSPARRLLTLFRRGHARREWETGRHLNAQGLPVPRPHVYGERRAFGVRAEEFYAGVFADDVKTLGQALNDDQPARMRTALLSRTARLVRALHDRGFDHQDLHAGNLLVRPGPGDVRGFLVVDLHRARTGVVVSRRVRVRAIAQWLHSLRQAVGPGGRLRIVRAYLGADAAPASVSDFYERVERRRARFHRTWFRSRGKRCFKNSTRYTRDVGRGVGARARELDQLRLDKALVEHDDALAKDDLRVAKRGHKGSVTTHGDVVVKETVGGGALGGLKDALSPDRHRAGYVNAHRLQVAGVSTARPLAYVRRGGRAFSLFEDVSHAPRLDHRVRALFSGPTPSERAVGLRLLSASADWMADLHRRGVYHGDLKAVNVRVDDESGAFRFVLIDTDRCRFSDDPVDERRRVKNLAQLAASIPVCVTRTDRLRWFRRYASGTGLSEQSVARAVAERLAEKTVVVDEPIE